jgi:hypothetical protein
MLAWDLETMDRLIRTAWRAFWVGLGASAVLITQSVLSPVPAPAPTPAEPAVAPLLAPVSPPAAVRTPQHTDPVLSKVLRCETVANTLRCS